MTPRDRGLAWLLVLVLAGCASPASPAPVLDGPAVSVLPLSLTGCVVVEALASVDAATARRHVPEPFAPTVVQGRTLVAFGAHGCGGDGAARVFVAIAVTPPEAFRNASVDRHFWEPEHFALGGDGFAAALARMGVNASVATRVDVAAAPPAPRVAASTEVGEFVVTGAGGTAAPQSRAFAGVFREWFSVPGGFAYLQAEFGGASARVGSGVGQVEAPAGSATADLLGGQRLPLVLLADAEYLDARVGVERAP